MKKFCGQCEKITSQELRRVGIDVGSRTFKAEVNVCEICGAYERDRELRNKISQWGDSLTSSFETLQPRLSETIHDYLEHRATGFGLDKSGLIKAMYVFYLNHAVSHKEFKKVREVVQKHESFLSMEEGRKTKMAVRISYRAFRKLEAYSLVWDCPPAKAIEDAVKFCVGLEATTNDHSNALLGELSEKYREVIQDIAMAA